MPYHFKYCDARFTIVGVTKRGWPICQFHRGFPPEAVRPEDLYQENDPAEIVQAMNEAPAAELVADA